MDVTAESRRTASSRSILRTGILASGVFLLATLRITEFACGQAPLDDDFEGPKTTWQFTDADAPYQVEGHQRTAQNAHRGTGCELVQFSAGNGRFVHLSLDIPPAHVIAEFRPALWVRANRPGIELRARVVFPRAADDKGQPLTRLVRGTTYRKQGSWEALHVDDIPKLVEAVVRPMRAQYGSHIDVREAYVDRLLLNVYCGPGRTQVALDDLELPHLVPVEGQGNNPAGQRAAAIPTRRRVELVGSILIVDDHPFFPRIIEHQGESLNFLKQLGFNAVSVPTAPTDALLEEARRSGMWLVCRPPVLPKQEGDDGPPLFDGRFEPVLAWHLGQKLGTLELEPMRERVEQIHRADEQANRPITCDPADELAQYARMLGAEGILTLHRQVLGTTFELADFATWLHTRPRLGVPGMPAWATIETQYNKELTKQISLLSGGQAAEPVADFEQIRLLVQAALSAGVRGLVFASHSPLDAQDTATRARALALSLANLELKLIHDWIAAGNITATIAATVNTTNTAGENPGITGAIVQASHTRLLLPYWVGTGAQYVPDQLAGNLITFVVKGAPDDNSVYELTVGGLRSLPSERRVGGVHVKQNEFGLTSMILLTDQLAVGAATAQLWEAAPRAAKLQRDLAAYKFNYVSEIDRQLARLADRVLNAPMLFDQARKDLNEAERNLTLKDWPAACLSAQRAMRPLRLVERGHWEKAIASIRSPAASPLVASFGEIPHQWVLARKLENLSRSRSLLEQGDFESPRAAWEAGWRPYRHSQQGITTTSSFVQTEHVSGTSSLYLAVKPLDADVPPSLIETPPLWVETPPISADSGQWFRIHGWVKVPKAIEASLEGLMIFDTLGGPALAERIGKTEGWKEFTLYRAAPASGPFKLVIALTGIGDAWVDGVTIETLYASQSIRALSGTGRNPQPIQNKRQTLRLGTPPRFPN